MSPSLLLAAESPLTESELRETLGYLEELRILRQENARLREVVAKDTAVIASIQGEVVALRAAQGASDRVIAAQDRLNEIEHKAMLAYKELALAEGLRADREKDRRESAEKWTFAGWVGTAVGIAAIVGSLLAN